jgi:hypothetical protein
VPPGLRIGLGLRDFLFCLQQLRTVLLQLVVLFAGIELDDNVAFL